MYNYIICNEYVYDSYYVNDINIIYVNTNICYIVNLTYNYYLYVIMTSFTIIV